MVSRSGLNTRIEVVTEGVFTRMILDDPELSGIGAVLFDEFHERSLDADLGLALALDCQRGLRNDLRILPMSATLDGAPVDARAIPLVDDGGAHEVQIVLGDRPALTAPNVDNGRASSGFTLQR
jgi:ATP-dependent helicase HrpB